MHKVASPQELQAELQSIMAFIHGHGPEGKPDRQVVAAKLRALADRVAAENTQSALWYELKVAPGVKVRQKETRDVYEVKQVTPKYVKLVNVQTGESNEAEAKNGRLATFYWEFV